MQVLDVIMKNLGSFFYLFLSLILVTLILVNSVHANECSINGDGFEDVSFPDELPTNEEEYYDALDDFTNNQEPVPNSEEPIGVTIDYASFEDEVAITKLAISEATSAAEFLVGLSALLLGLENAIEVITSENASDLDKATAAVFYVPIVNIIMADIDLFAHAIEKNKAIKKVNRNIRYLNHLDQYEKDSKEEQQFSTLLDNISKVVSLSALKKAIKDDIDSVMQEQNVKLLDEVSNIKESLYPIYAEKIYDDNPIFDELSEVISYAINVHVIPNEIYSSHIISNQTRLLCRIDTQENLITSRRDRHTEHDPTCIHSIITDYADRVLSEMMLHFDSYSQSTQSPGDSLLDPMNSYINTFNHFMKNAVLRRTDVLHGALIKSVKHTLELYQLKAEEIVSEAKLLLELSSEARFYDRNNMNNQGQSLEPYCWQEGQRCMSAHEACMDKHNNTLYCSLKHLTADPAVCEGTGSYTYICHTVHYHPNSDLYLVSAKNHLDYLYDDVMFSKQMCEQSEYQNCFANDLLHAVLKSNHAISKQDFVDLIQYAALEVSMRAISNNASLVLHVWGENDRMGELGDIFAYERGEQVEYFQLTGLGGDGKYWYFPASGGDNSFWTYRGNTLTELFNHHAEIEQLLTNVDLIPPLTLQQQIEVYHLLSILDMKSSFAGESAFSTGSQSYPTRIQ